MTCCSHRKKMMHTSHAAIFSRKSLFFMLIAMTLICLTFQYLYGGESEYYKFLLQHVTYEVSNGPEGPFLVSSSKCKIPDIHPVDKSLWDVLEAPRIVNCTDKTPLTSVVPINESRRQFKIIVNTDPLILEQYTSDPYSMKCCYSVIRRITNPPSAGRDDDAADNRYEKDDCIYFGGETVLAPEVEYFFVYCYAGYVLPVYSNIHAVVPVKSSVEDRLSKEYADKSPLSFLMVGIDGTSRLNFIRTMRKTLNFIKDRDWFELRGYNKVGSNTFPNVVAALAGSDVKMKDCSLYGDTVYDDCPLLWKLFRKYGYITAYGEDAPSISTFNYWKTGFIKSPTDYYLRPFMLAGYSTISFTYRDFQRVCIGALDITTHMLQYALDFVTTFHKHPYFAFFWFNNFSHENHNTVASSDDNFIEFFETLESRGILNSTAVIFFSDHGMRFGSIRNKEVGRMEDKLPFIYIWFPKWFRQKNPKSMKNLRENGARLTSPFDLHQTIEEYLELDLKVEVEKNEEYRSHRCESSVSLFNQVPFNRSCDEACIPPEWCACTTYDSLSVDDDFGLKAVQTALGNLESLIEEANKDFKNDSDSKCAQLELHSITKVKKKVQNGDSNIDEYMVEFVTIPGEALFEAIIRHDVTSDEYIMIGNLNRINRYGDQSKCIENTLLKNYCYCIQQNGV